MFNINRILVPFDFSEHAENALNHAMELAQQYEATVDVLYVLEIIATPTIDKRGHIKLRTDNDPSVLEPSRKALEQRLETIGVEANAHVARGSTVEEIKQFVIGHDVDLIVISSHGISGIRARLLGSISRAVLEDVGCPVLLLKSHGSSLLDDSA